MPCSDVDEEHLWDLMRSQGGFQSALSSLVPWGLPTEACGSSVATPRDIIADVTTDVNRADFPGHCPGTEPQNYCEWGPCRDLEEESMPARRLPRLPSFRAPSGRGTTFPYVENARKSQCAERDAWRDALAAREPENPTTG